jgi:hypothetical protein
VGPRGSILVVILFPLLVAASSRPGFPETGGGIKPGGSTQPEILTQPMLSLDRPVLRVPLTALTDPARARAEAVLNREVFAQRISGIRYRSREPIYEFLLDHPDFAAGVARALQVGQYQLERVDDTFVGDDQRGAHGVIRLLYTETGLRLYHLEGRYEAKGLPALSGEMLILLEFHHEDDGEGGTVVDQSLTGHLKIDTPVVGPLAALLTGLARPILTQAVDRKVRRFFQTVARVSRWAYDQPEQLMAALDQNPEVPQGTVLAAFARIILADRLPGWAREPYRLLPDPPAPADGS